MTEPELLCDFCAAPNPQHRIHSIGFDVDDVVPVTAPMTSTGDFLACDACNAIIQGENRQGLLTRARTEFIRQQRIWSVNHERQLVRFHEQFWGARIRVREDKPDV